MKFLKTLYLKNFLFILLGLNVLVFLLGYFFPILTDLAKLGLLIIAVLVFIDILSLYRLKNGVSASRECADRLSNGDDNEISVRIYNAYNFAVTVTLIEELPEQFQIRNFKFEQKIETGDWATIKYLVKPVKRGEYNFGKTHVFARGFLGLASRRFSFGSDKVIKIYPSFIQLKKYDLAAVLGKYVESGLKRTRKVGHNMEFDQIRDYIMGDDVRSLNWKATARRGSFMVNQYQDEKSQQVFCMIDKGRSMKMPFEQMTLLDYAINASLVISNIVLKKDDKAGLIAYNRKVSTFIPAERKTGQLNKIIHSLYNEKTAFVETNNEVLYLNIKKQINHRSLLFLFTNFETLSSFRRQLPYFKKISQNHLLVVIFFENTEVKKLLNKEANSLDEIYFQVAAEKFSYEKKLISRELSQHGILSILTTPQNLTIQLINKYLEIKGKNLL